MLIRLCDIFVVSDVSVFVIYCSFFSVCFYFFFFKQKTAYEMRISDWSSDVCSSDLVPGVDAGRVDRHLDGSASPVCRIALDGPGPLAKEIGRASCRERVCQYV